MGTTFVPQSTEAEPEELAAAITRRLSAADVPFTARGIVDGSGLDVSVPGGRWALDFAGGGVTVDWNPRRLGILGPRELAELAAALLTAQPLRTGHPDEKHVESITSTAGKHLVERGFEVELLVYPDTVGYDACHEIKIRLPGTRTGTDAPAAYINSTGGLVWYHDTSTGASSAALADVLTAAITASLKLS